MKWKRPGPIRWSPTATSTSATMPRSGVTTLERPNSGTCCNCGSTPFHAKPPTAGRQILPAPKHRYRLITTTGVPANGGLVPEAPFTPPIVGCADAPARLILVGPCRLLLRVRPLLRLQPFIQDFHAGVLLELFHVIRKLLLDGLLLEAFFEVRGDFGEFHLFGRNLFTQLNDVIAELGGDDVADLIGVQGKGSRFKFGRHLAPRKSVFAALCLRLLQRQALTRAPYRAYSPRSSRPTTGRPKSCGQVYPPKQFQPPNQ